MARILIVEDEQWIADCYSLWLKPDYDVQRVRDAQEALDAIDAIIPDLIILDLLLPHASGVQLLHTLQSYADMASIPVIVCSGSPPASIPYAPYGIRTVLHKADVTPDVLRRTVAEVL